MDYKVYSNGWCLHPKGLLHGTLSYPFGTLCRVWSMYTYAAYFFMNFKTLIHIQANKGVLGSTHLNLIIHIAPWPRRIKCNIISCLKGVRWWKWCKLKPTWRMMLPGLGYVVFSNPHLEAINIGHLEGEQPQLGDLLAIVINYLLNGMIHQVPSPLQTSCGVCVCFIASFKFVRID